MLSHEEFESYFPQILRDDPEASHSLAEMMLRFMDAIVENPTRPIKATNSLRDGIEILYFDTVAHDLAFDLYLSWLRGRLKPQDEPITLIKGAIARQTAKTAARKRRQPDQNRETGKRNVTKITDNIATKGSKNPAPKSNQRENRAPSGPQLISPSQMPAEPAETPVNAADTSSK